MSDTVKNALAKARGLSALVLLSSLATGSLAQDIAVNPGAVDFGTVEIGSSETRTVEVQNISGAPVVLASFGLGSTTGGEFSAVGGGPGTLAPGATSSLDVTFTPTVVQPGGSVGFVEAVVDGGGQVFVFLFGMAEAGGGGTPLPEIDVTPGAHDFGEVELDTTANVTVTVANQGTGELVVTNASLGVGSAAAYTLVGGPQSFTLPASGSQDLSITFNPTVEGDALATLSIASNDADEPIVTVPLSGTGIDSSVGGAPQISVTPTSHDFGSVVVGMSSVMSFTVSNIGTADLVVTSISTSGGDFNVTDGAPATLMPTQTLSVEVTYAPQAAEVDADSLAIASNDATTPAFSVALTGAGITAPTGPAMQVTPTTVAFGDVEVGSALSREVTVTNVGGQPLVVQSLLEFGSPPPPQFEITVNPTPITLAVGEETTIEITYTPDAEASHSGSTLVIPSAVDPVLINYTGTGVPASPGGGSPNVVLSPSPVAFGDAPIGAPATANLTIENTGNGPLNVTNVQVVGSATFALAGPFQAAVVPAGQSIDVPLTFTPTGLGAVQGVAIVSSDDPDTSVSFVSVNGVGTDAGPTDTVPPLCELTQVTPGANRSVEVTVQDVDSGIAEINILIQTNVNVTIPAFTPGVTDALVIHATQTVAGQTAQLFIEVVDMAGNASTCDPVLKDIEVEAGVAYSEAFTGIPQAERFVTVYNGSPGFELMRVTVNGAGIFILSGLRANEIRTVDVAGYMTSGTSNVIELSAPAGIAASATLLISDGLPAISTDPGPQFVRGDPNLDGFVDHSDPLAILEGLFLGSGGIQCQDAADINDDSRVDVTDPIVLLGYLYLGTGVNPAQPFPSCGRDTTTDDLDCAGLTACP